MKKRMRLSMAVLAILLIGTGCFMIYPPLCPLSIGVLLWIDLSFGGAEVKAKR